MKIDWLKSLLGHPGPFATLYLDATPAAEAGDRDVANRWRAVRKSLTHQGAPEAVLGDVETAVLRPTRASGPHGRVVIADDTGVLVDRVVKSPPAVASGVWAPVPALLQAALATDESVEVLCVTVDRQGADFARWGTGGKTTRSFEASHDEIAKTSSPNTKHARIESRAEDSWERNAEAVAAEIERQVKATRPEIVLLTGDVRAVSLVRAELVRPVAELTVEVPGGGRSAGVRADTFEEHIEDALDSFRERRRELVLAELRQELGREAGAVTSLADVVSVLARGQVKELVLAEEYATDAATDGRLGARMLWIGPSPLDIAPTRRDLESTGVTERLEQLPATIALVRSAIGQDAGLTFAPEGSVDLIEGVGATLRWYDEGTPTEAVHSMSGDDMRLRGDLV